MLLNFMTRDLQSGKPSLGTAHDLLLNNGYEFVGYHGTSYKGLQSIVPHGFDPQYIGTGAGTERGIGFYVSWKINLSRDIADGCILLSDGPSPDLAPVLYSGDAGIPCILRIYAKNFETMNLNVDYRWGLQKNAGGKNNPNGDLGVKPYDQKDKERDAAEKIYSLELVFNPDVYSRLAAIPAANPALNSQQNEQLNAALDQDRPQWAYHLVDEQVLQAKSGKHKPKWPVNLFFKQLLQRQSSEPNRFSNLQEFLYKQKDKNDSSSSEDKSDEEDILVTENKAKLLLPDDSMSEEPTPTVSFDISKQFTQAAGELERKYTEPKESKSTTRSVNGFAFLPAFQQHMSSVTSDTSKEIAQVKPIDGPDELDGIDMNLF